MASMRRYLLSTGFVCFAIAGCGKAAPNLTEVEGTLKLRGKPLVGVLVQFIPVPPKDSVKGAVCPTSTGVTDDQGHYRLMCEHPPAPGAVVGSHHVTLLEGKKKQPLELKYMMFRQTPLVAEVHADGPQVIDFEVK